MKALLAALMLSVCMGAVCWASPESMTIESQTLPNGLRVVLAPDRSAPAVHVAVWYRSGSRDDRSGHTGLAALVERLSWRAAAGATDLGVREQAVGGTPTSATTPDYTCFQAVLPPEQLEVGLAAEAERMTALRASEADFKADKAQVIEQQRNRSAQPLTSALDRLFELAFVRHPYRQPLYGGEDDLGMATLEECRAYHASRYAPSNAVLTVTGSFTPARALTIIQKRFGAIPKRAAASRVAVAEPVQDAERRAQVKSASPAALLLVGWPAPADSSRDAAAVELLTQLLAGGRNARLNPSADSSRSVLQLQGAFDSRREPSLITLTAVVKPEGDKGAAERQVVEAAERASSQPPSADELERCKNQLETAFLLNWQSVQNRGQWIGQGAVRFGDPRAATKRLQRVRAATPEDVRRAAERYLKSDRRNVVWVVPETANAGGGE